MTGNVLCEADAGLSVLAEALRAITMYQVALPEEGLRGLAPANERKISKLVL